MEHVNTRPHTQIQKTLCPLLQCVVLIAQNNQSFFKSNTPVRMSNFDVRSSG